MGETAGTQHSRDEETGLLEGLAAAAKEQCPRVVSEHCARLYPRVLPPRAQTRLQAWHALRAATDVELAPPNSSNDSTEPRAFAE